MIVFRRFRSLVQSKHHFEILRLLFEFLISHVLVPSVSGYVLSRCSYTTISIYPLATLYYLFLIISWGKGNNVTIQTVSYP
jgi:hypothetical protein